MASSRAAASLSSSGAADDDRPNLDEGDVISNPNNDNSYKVVELIGEGRCCVVYSGHSIRDPSQPLALKVYRRGRSYEGALHREQYILNMFNDPKHNIVTQYEYFKYKDLHIQVMELLEFNVRQLIFRNNREGLSPWILQRFCKDISTALHALHESKFVHADLKPANVMWSKNDGRFKLLDFGLTFHTEEKDLHQIQTKGYQAPEVADWNSYKDDQRKHRRRKLQGTYCDLRRIAPAYNDKLNQVTSNASSSVVSSSKEGERWPSESSGIFTASELSQCVSPATTSSSASSNVTVSQSTALSGAGSSDIRDSSSPGCSRTTLTKTSNRRHSVVCGTEQLLGQSPSLKSPGAVPAPGDDEPDWRRARKVRPSPINRPQMPGTAADIWSFGCLVFELFTGSKLYRAGDKMASILRPYQLLDMKLGNTEIKYKEQDSCIIYQAVVDLLLGCVDEEPHDRLTAAKCIEHPFLEMKDGVSYDMEEMKLLPTKVVKLYLLEECNKDKSEDYIPEILKEFEKFGTIGSYRIEENRLYIEFAEASMADRAVRCTVCSEERLIVAFYYPLALWTLDILQ